MLAQSDQPSSEFDPEIGSEVDPATLPPLCDEAEFAQEIAELVADEAPRLFAVVQEYGERVDGCIAAWGLAFADYADIVRVDHGRHLILRSPERAVRLFSHSPHITARLVWVNPEPPARPEDDEVAS
jgi:hypothetical protein